MPESSTPSSSQKPLLRALRGESLSRPPIWLMRQAGRYLPEYRALRGASGSFLEFCFSPERAAEATLQPVRRFGMDGAILFSDILVVPYALGRSVGFREGEGPVLDPLRRRDEISALDRDGIIERLAPVYAAIRLVKPALVQSVALIGFAGAPWTVATYMIEGGSSRDFSAVKRWAFGDPEGFAELIDRLADATIEHLSAQVSAGVDAVQLFDSWAGVLPEHEFQRFVIAPTRRIVAALAARHPGLPVIGFPRGAGLLYRAYVKETKIGAVSLDQSVPCDIAHKTLQSLVPVQGNLDPMLLVLG
ncbi:MAG TPA: uroporphyrinogen decarboxylase, partial [Stellaceae bacterium]|nr:uroporphyrinogen decarboxylase [Stellaceae bacterium]